MAVSPSDEDVITMGANAGEKALQQVNRREINSIMFATESGIDQSKAGAVYLHKLLNLPEHCNALEIKQACYGGTAALFLAMGMVCKNPRAKILVIASDIARYGLNTPGEPTQGAGAVAMVISGKPKILEFDTEPGSYTQEVMDFWRPNYKQEAIVNGKLSIKMYLHALRKTWIRYQLLNQVNKTKIEAYCYHLPFTRIANKAHQALMNTNEYREQHQNSLLEEIRDGLRYNSIIGNTYTASLYIAFLSMLETSERDFTNKRIGLFSYGSGCVASFFSGKVLPNYQNYLQKDYHLRLLQKRIELSYEKYCKFHSFQLPTGGQEFSTPVNYTGRFRLAGIENHKRIYTQNLNGFNPKALREKIFSTKVRALQIASPV